MPSAPEIRLSVVIPTWNAADHVARVLTHLVKQEHDAFEIVVVDNGVINADTEKVCDSFRAQFPRLRYLRFPKQLGYAGAVNEGAAAAAADLVAVSNNDNLPDPRWLPELEKKYGELRARGKEAIVTSLVHRPDFPDPLGARLNIWGRIVRDPAAPHFPLMHPDGSSFLFSRAALGRPYDPDYFIYHEDVALGWRAWLMGYEVALAASSRAETFDGGATRRIKYLTAFYTERNRWLNVFLFLSAGSLLKLLPLLWLDALAKLAVGRQRRAKLHAWAWIATHPGRVFAKRAETQALRKRADAEILRLFSFAYADGRAGALLNPLGRAYARLWGWA